LQIQPTKGPAKSELIHVRTPDAVGLIIRSVPIC
jgi:hypothetical protein